MKASITASMTASILGFGLAVALIGGNANAMSPKQTSPGSVGYSRDPIVETHAEALSKSWQKAENAWDGDYQTLNSSLKSYQSALESAQKSEADARAALAKADDTRTREQQNLDSLNSRISDLDKGMMNGTVSNAERARQLQEIELAKRQGVGRVDSARKQSEAMKAELAKAQEAVSHLQSSIQDHMSKTYGQNLDVKAMNQGDLQAQVASLRDTVLKDRKAEQVQRVTDQLFDSVKEDYLKSEFLVSDLSHLKEQYGMTGERLESVKRSVEKRLSETLLGNYVQEQIKKAIAQTCGNSQFQAACAAGNVQGVQDILGGILRTTQPYVSSGTKPASDNAPGDSQKPVDSTSGAGK